MNNNFKINDVVRIFDITENQIIQPEEIIGYIKEIKEIKEIKFVYFQEIHFNSFCGKMGWIPIDCIEHYSNEKYNQRLKEILENKIKEKENT